MREILFRGKRRCNGAWVLGGFHSRFDNAFIIGCSKSFRIDGTDVVPETVGQYTGLTDKNGTKIFEGDIVTIDLPFIPKRTGVVTYTKDYFGVDIKGINPIQNCLSYTMENGVVEVIGNIHENPELMKRGEEYV